jgi:branched-chain amino acid transport system substrate-binding protein
MTTTTEGHHTITRRTLIAGAAATMAAPAILRAQSNEILIGAILPMTGLGGGYGQNTWLGVQGGCDYVNARGGIKAMGGARLKAILGDSETRPEVAAAQVENLARRGAVALIGTAQSAATIVASQQCERLKIALLTANDLDPLITARGFKYVFRANCLMEAYVKDLFEYMRVLADKHGQKILRAALLCDTSILGHSSQKLALDHARQYGIEIVDNSTFEAGRSQNFASYIAKYKALKIDVFIAGTIQTVDSIALVRAMKEQRYNPMIFGSISGGPSTESFMENVKDDANGILVNMGFVDTLDVPGLKADLDSYHASTGKQMDTSAMSAFSAISILWDALERAKSTDRVALRDAIASTDLKLGERGFFLLDGVKFNAAGDNERARSIITVIRDGKWLAVAPANIAQGEASVPKPAWN